MLLNLLLNGGGGMDLETAGPEEGVVPMGLLEGCGLMDLDLAGFRARACATSGFKGVQTGLDLGLSTTLEWEPTKKNYKEWYGAAGLSLTGQADGTHKGYPALGGFAEFGLRSSDLGAGVFVRTGYESTLAPEKREAHFTALLGLDLAIPL